MKIHIKKKLAKQVYNAMLPCHHDMVFKSQNKQLAVANGKIRDSLRRRDPS